MVMSRKERIIWSAVIALGFLMLSYFFANISFSIKGEKMLLRRVELVRNRFWPREKKVIDSVLFVNVAYDKEMRPAFDEFGDSLGVKPITDRRKLLKMLKILKNRNDYKYILLDVHFGENTQTEWDSLLFETIEAMPRILIPKHTDEVLADERLKVKAGMASFGESFWVYGFTKYPYYWKNQKTIPVKMYEETKGRELKKIGPLYFDGWRLTKGCEFLPLEITANTPYDDGGDKIWYNLGVDLLEDGALSSNSQLTKDKYIVVGSFQGDDMVSTFKGSLSGAVVNYNAFHSLMSGKHRVSLGFSILLFVLFFILSYNILNHGQREKKEFFKNWMEKKGLFWKVTLFLLLPLVKYNLILQGVCVLVYLAFGRIIEVMLVSAAFYYFSLIVKLKKQIQLWQEKK